VRLEGLGQLKNPMTSPGIEAATFLKHPESFALPLMSETLFHTHSKQWVTSFCILSRSMCVSIDGVWIGEQIY
jgi:hypothetical protein